MKTALTTGGCTQNCKKNLRLLQGLGYNLSIFLVFVCFFVFRFSSQAQYFVDLEVQISWQVQDFVDVEVQFSWQVQDFVRLGVQISWQAQYFVDLEVQISWQVLDS